MLASWTRALGIGCSFALVGCADKPQKPSADTDVAVSDEPGAARPESTATVIEGTAELPIAEDRGPTVEIPAGSFKAGSACADVPRSRPDEPMNETVTLGDFEIDAHPYPNEPGKPALVGVSWEEASRLCAERGKRLCTELEWERACKGPEGTYFPWSGTFSTTKCGRVEGGLIGQRPECKSGFGVMDMVGLAGEWTASGWERGAPTGDKVVRGGGPDALTWLDARCARVHKRSPHEGHDGVGFRCCSGPVNSAKVVLSQDKGQTLVAEPGIDVGFESAMRKAMPSDHRSITGFEIGFDQVYRWHPVANEELIVARWKATPQRRKGSRASYEVAVFTRCGERLTLSARMKGPAARVSRPKVATTPSKLSFDVETDDSRGTVTLSYWYGSVKVTEPEWVVAGNLVPEVEKEPRDRRTITPSRPVGRKILRR